MPIASPQTASLGGLSATRLAAEPWAVIPVARLRYRLGQLKLKTRFLCPLWTRARTSSRQPQHSIAVDMMVQCQMATAATKISSDGPRETMISA